MKQIIALILIAVLAPAAWSQGMAKKKSVESAATPAATTTAPVKGPAKAAPAAKAVKGKSWTGTVSSVVSCANGKCSAIDKADAKKATDRNEILCFCVGSKCYLVLNSDGTNASGKLADKAGSKVTISGKVMSKGGFNIIMANDIQ